jgi:DNA-binding NarL/FixJ family response regulator
MKIHVIDNAGQIPLLLSAVEADVAVYTDEIQALNAAEQQQPELILLNFSMRGRETPEYIGLLLTAGVNTRIVVIGENTSEEHIVSCLLAGAIGYQESQQLHEYIAKMINVVVDGEAWISRKMIAHLLATLRLRQSIRKG